MTQPSPAAEQLLNLADRAEKGLTADEAARLRAGIARLLTRAEQAEASYGDVRSTLANVLSRFVHKGHPGEPCLSSGWITVKAVERWRAALDPQEPQP